MDLDALADKSLSREEIASRLNAEKIKSDLRAKARDATAVLGRQTPQARQTLRKLLESKIELQPVGSGRQRGYQFRGALTVYRLINGEAFADKARPEMVAPTGFAV